MNVYFSYNFDVTIPEFEVAVTDSIDNAGLSSIEEFTFAIGYIQNIEGTYLVDTNKIIDQ